MSSIPIGSATRAASVQPTTNAGVTRRLAALSYDLLLLIAVWMLVTLVVAMTRDGEPIPPGDLWYQLLLLAVAAAFFVASWTRGGQTVGMRAWRLVIQRDTGAPLDTRTALVRFALGLMSMVLCGVGLWWCWLDRDGRTPYDRLAGTRVIVVPKSAPS